MVVLLLSSEPRCSTLDSPPVRSLAWKWLEAAAECRSSQRPLPIHVESNQWEEDLTDQPLPLWEPPCGLPASESGTDAVACVPPTLRLTETRV